MVLEDLAEVFSAFDVLNYCLDPGIPEHGNRTPTSGVFFENANARFRCQEGYRLEGPSKITCVRQHDGFLSWKPSEKPACLPEACLVPHIAYAEVYNKTYKPGDKLIVKCHDGFQIRYPDLDSTASVCQDDGLWDILPICQGCLRPLTNPHSYVNVSESESSFAVGTVIYFQCFPGYKLEGTELLECMYSLIWSDSPPRCLDVEVCPLPPVVDHGDYICHPQPCDRYIHGTVVEFFCDDGYSLNTDYKYITCQHGYWFPSNQAYCIKSDEFWPDIQGTSLTTWKIVSFTASSVLLALLLVIFVKVFQIKFKGLCQPRNGQDSSSNPDILVVDGVPVILPSYDEAITSGFPTLSPGYSPSAGQGYSQYTEEQSPPAYPGHTDPGIMTQPEPANCPTTDVLSHSCEPNSNTSPSSLHKDETELPACEASATDTSESTVATSPVINIADDIPLIEEDI
ncbi:sushi domain-containing protein 4 [Protopterus annectens]|uniref:sushi domain-containing protein 4 n=1 Tax=Protopterus annectens TaxID=7888 RepID=UPI001CFA95CE|nr:sushi domain-containing protein 4 [Protopterus annectens]